MKAYKHLVNFMLNRGYVISVGSEGVTDLRRSSDEKAILEAIEAVDEASIRIRLKDAGHGGHLASALIIAHGMADDETVADFSDKPLMTEWQLAYDALPPDGEPTPEGHIHPYHVEGHADEAGGHYDKPARKTQVQHLVKFMLRRGYLISVTGEDCDIQPPTRKTAAILSAIDGSDEETVGIHIWQPSRNGGVERTEEGWVSLHKGAVVSQWDNTLMDEWEDAYRLYTESHLTLRPETACTNCDGDGWKTVTEEDNGRGQRLPCHLCNTEAAARGTSTASLRPEAPEVTQAKAIFEADRSTSFTASQLQAASLRDPEPTQEPERGAASILIELTGGNITVYHGTDKTVLAQGLAVPKGSWEQIWKTLDRFCARTYPETVPTLQEVTDFIREEFGDPNRIVPPTCWEDFTTNPPGLAAPEGSVIPATGVRGRWLALPHDPDAKSCLGISYDDRLEAYQALVKACESAAASQQPSAPTSMASMVQLVAGAAPQTLQLVIGADYEYTGPNDHNLRRIRYCGQNGPTRRFSQVTEDGTPGFTFYLPPELLSYLRPVQTADTITISRRHALQLHSMTRDLIDLDDAEVEAFEELDRLISDNPTGAEPDPEDDPDYQARKDHDDAVRERAYDKYQMMGDRRAIDFDEDADIEYSKESGCAWVSAMVLVPDAKPFQPAETDIHDSEVHGRGRGDYDRAEPAQEGGK